MKQQINRSQSMLEIGNRFTTNQGTGTEITKFKQQLPDYGWNKGVTNHFISLGGSNEPPTTSDQGWNKGV